MGRIVIAGGGIMGSCAAYHLARAGAAEKAGAARRSGGAEDDPVAGGAGRIKGALQKLFSGLKLALFQQAVQLRHRVGHG